MLQEDKGLNFLNDSDCPGQILIKIGFGVSEVASSPEVEDHWSDALDRATRLFPFFLRFNVFQVLRMFLFLYIISYLKLILFYP